MQGTRTLILLIGIFLPYCARLVAALFMGPSWFADYLDAGLLGFVVIGAFNTINWGAVILTTLSFRHPRSSWFPAVFGFALPLVGHASLDLGADAQAAVALAVLPFASLPLVFIGWLVGLWYDRRTTVIESQANQSSQATAATRLASERSQ